MFPHVMLGCLIVAVGLEGYTKTGEENWASGIEGRGFTAYPYIMFNFFSHMYLFHGILEM